MGQSELLPGVEPARPISPNRAAHAAAVIRKARRDALLRDAIDAFILAAVDLFFVRWPDAHIPMFDRGQTMIVLAAMHAAIITGWIMARSFPSWRARHIARTWCPRERSRHPNGR